MTTEAAWRQKFDADQLTAHLQSAVRGWRFSAGAGGRMLLRAAEFAAVLGDCAGDTVQDRWDDFEARVWPEWVAGRDRIGGELWRWGTWAVVLTRTARPTWAFMRPGVSASGLHTFRLRTPSSPRLGSSRAPSTRSTG